MLLTLSTEVTFEDMTSQIKWCQFVIEMLTLDSSKVNRQVDYSDTSLDVVDVCYNLCLQRSQRRMLSERPGWWSSGSAWLKREMQCWSLRLAAASPELLQTGKNTNAPLCICQTHFTCSPLLFLSPFTSYPTPSRTPPSGMEAHIPVLFLDLNGTQTRPLCNWSFTVFCQVV